MSHAEAVYDYEQDDICDLNCFLKNFKLDLNMTKLLGDNSTFNFTEEVGVIPVSGYINLKEIKINRLELSALDTEKGSDNRSFNVITVVKSLEGSVKADLSCTALSITKEFKDLNLVLNLVDTSLSVSFGFNSEKYPDDDGYDLVKDTNVTVDTNLTLTKSTVVADPDQEVKLGLIKISLNTLIGWVIKPINNKIGPLIKEEGSKGIQDALNGVFADVNEKYVKKYIDGVDKRNITLYQPPVMKNITEASIFDTLSWATTFLLGGDSSLGLNNLIRRFTNGTGTFFASKTNTDYNTFSDLCPKMLQALTFSEEDAIPIQIEDVTDAKLEFEINELNVSGLATWNNMEFFEPLRQVKDKKTQLGMCELEENCDYQVRVASGLELLEIKLDFSINVTMEGNINTSNKKLQEAGVIYIKVTDNYMEGRLQLAIPDGVFSTYSNNQCKNMTCWAALIKANGTGIPLFYLNSSIDALSLVGSNAASNSNNSLEVGVQRTVSVISDVMIGMYKPVIPVFLSGLVNEEGSSMIDRVINSTFVKSCESDPDEILKEYKAGVVASTVSIAAVLSVLLCIIAIVFFVVRWRRKRHEETSDSEVSSSKSEDSDDEKEKVPLCKRIIGFPVWVLRQFIRTDPEGASLFLNERVNIVLRIVIPFIILLNVALFITSNTGTGATVNAYITVDGQVISIPVADFGLMNSVMDMWEAKVYPLSVLIMVFSGIWPYLKLAVLLFCWMIPQSIVSSNKRGVILKVLDALGKWSLLDSYVMVLMIVAFFFDVPIPLRHENSVDQPTAVNLYVYPAYGFVSLILGTLFSLLLSHVVVFVHNYLLRRPSDNLGEEAQKFRPLVIYAGYDISFKDCREGETKKKVLSYLKFGFTWFIRVGVVVGLVLTTIFIILGIVLISFSFEFLGLAGWALKQLGYEYTREFSVVDLGVQLPGATREPNSFAVRITQVIYFVTIMAIPFLHIISMFILWLVPLKRRFQKWMLTVCDVLYAWSCIDVFVVSVIAAIVELSQFASFMVEPMCGAKIEALGYSIDEIVGKFFGEEEIVNGHETCFEVKAVLNSGCWILFIAVIIYTIISLVILKVSKKALIKRLPSEEERAKIEGKEGEEVEMNEECMEAEAVIEDGENDISNEEKVEEEAAEEVVAEEGAEEKEEENEDVVVEQEEKEEDNVKEKSSEELINEEDKKEEDEAIESSAEEKQEEEEQILEDEDKTESIKED